MAGPCGTGQAMILKLRLVQPRPREYRYRNKPASTNPAPVIRLKVPGSATPEAFAVTFAEYVRSVLKEPDPLLRAKVPFVPNEVPTVTLIPVSVGVNTQSLVPLPETPAPLSTVELNVIEPAVPVTMPPEVA